MNTTEKIAQFVARLDLSEVPERARAIAKGGIIDALGVAIAGTQTEVAHVVTRWTRAIGGTPSAGVIGGAFKTSSATAARANGAIGHALDFDPPLPMLPALLALAECERASGRDVLAAYVAGFEVQSKLQRGVSDKHSAHGWHSNTVFGTFGATAAAAKVLKLDARQVQMAFGIAASEASGIRENLGTMTKPLHAGIAAANGITAATLAREGLTSCVDGIGGEFGALRLFAMPGEYDEQQIADTFGSPWNIVAREIRIKPYPCCRWAHRPLDALLALTRANNVRVDDVETIECEVGAHVSEVMTYPVAQTELQAKFCLPYCLAVAVCDGRAGLGQFTGERARDAHVQALAARVRVIHPDGKSEFETGTRLPCTVRVRLKDGTVLEQGAGAARGDRENPMTFEDIVEKYRDCTRGLLAAEKAERVLTLVQDIENAPDLGELFSILTFDIRT
ncbi:MAG TPA: MmgE/PrpD family protein [Burkholderiales bacterium]|nr:MmgE/PrpD family protein [Burkholderiales bacterium]